MICYHSNRKRIQGDRAYVLGFLSPELSLKLPAALSCEFLCLWACLGSWRRGETRDGRTEELRIALPNGQVREPLLGETPNPQTWYKDLVLRAGNRKNRTTHGGYVEQREVLPVEILASDRGPREEQVGEGKPTGLRARQASWEAHMRPTWICPLAGGAGSPGLLRLRGQRLSQRNTVLFVLSTMRL